MDAFSEDRPVGVALIDGVKVAWQQFVDICSCVEGHALSHDTRALCKLGRATHPIELYWVIKQFRAENPEALELLAGRVPFAKARCSTALRISPAWGSPCDCGGDRCLDFLKWLIPAVAVFEEKAAQTSLDVIS